MPRELTIDGSGRLVIPKDVRIAHRLEAGTRLILAEEDDRLVLTPVPTQPKLVERHGLLVVTGIDPEGVPDHRALREERLAALAP